LKDIDSATGIFRLGSLVFIGLTTLMLIWNTILSLGIIRTSEKMKKFNRKLRKNVWDFNENIVEIENSMKETIKYEGNLEFKSFFFTCWIYCFRRKCSNSQRFPYQENIDLRFDLRRLWGYYRLFLLYGINWLWFFEYRLFWWFGFRRSFEKRIGLDQNLLSLF